MTQVAPTSASWFPRRGASARLPSVGASLVFHGVMWVFLLWLSQLPSCRGDMSGDGGDSFRKVGIHTKGKGDGTGGGGIDEQARSAPQPAPPQPMPAAAAPPMSAPPPLSAPQFPNTALAPAAPAFPLLGPGPAFAPPVGMNTVTPSVGDAAGGFVPRAFGPPGNGAPAGGTSFMGIGDVGKKFVYVIDRSASMGADNALQFAKNELLASVELLKENQQFQVIFYNSEFVVMNPRGANMFTGNAAQRLQVNQQLAEIQPDGGTAHLPALLKALSFDPDVIFLLTDGADTSMLTPGDLKQVAQKNRSGTHIHTIEFGRAAQSELGSLNFLKDLSDQNLGRYSYRQIVGN